MSIEKFLERNKITKIEQPEKPEKVIKQLKRKLEVAPESFYEENKPRIIEVYIKDDTPYRETAKILTEEFGMYVSPSKVTHYLKVVWKDENVWRYRKDKQALREIEEALDKGLEELEKEETSEEQLKLEEEFFKADDLKDV